MHTNVCINDNFLNSTRLAAMPEIVSQMCGFTENMEQREEAKEIDYNATTQGH